MNSLKKTIGIAAICLTAAIPVRANIVAEADSAYISDDFTRAITLYGAAIDSLGPSAERYYNLGNAYFRADKPGMAIVSYERALRLDPSNNDVRDNLEFVKSRITDRIESGDSFISNSMDSTARALHPDLWAWFALASFLLFIAGTAAYMAGSGIMLRKAGFFGGIAMLAICMITASMAIRAAGLATASHRAIIIKPSVILSTTPRQPKDRSEEAFLLHEGTPVMLLDSISEPSDPTGRLKWYDVKVDNSHRAWIQSDAIERI
ncbi:MAG: tetratricopeptide repeat protein [Muribaculaceae bacterium]|nr:tetratricopeptide repeat protein [Muribaculaceae bacterium]